MAATAPKAVPANINTQPSRMRLSAVVKGKQEQLIRVLMYGTEGIGKSTFASLAPSPIFICAEDGTNHLDVPRFPKIERWTEALEAIAELSGAEHEYRTLVVDTLDWLEQLLWVHVCARDNKPSIESYDYGKGYSAALDQWRVLIGALERLQKTKRMGVVLLAHAHIRTFKNPMADDYDKYELKLNTKAAGLFKEWSEAVLFACSEVFVERDKSSKRTKAISTGVRIAYTEKHAAFDAKNRYGLPNPLPLSWEEFEAAMKGPDVAALVSEIEGKAQALGGAMEKHTLDALKRANGDASKLAQLNNWAAAKLAEKEQSNG